MDLHALRLFLTVVERGSFVEARTDADGTAWRVNWELSGLTRVR